MSSKRAKGYMLGWKPQAETQALLDQIGDVLDSYADYLPMTARQIFYRLVGRFNYDKTELAYSRLCETLVKARRARIVSFDAIRDDGTYSSGGGGMDSVEDWWQAELSMAKAYTRDRMAGQDVRIEVWCEAAGMAPQLARVAAPYGVSTYSTGGFSSVTVTHEIARRVIAGVEPTVFMHLGDFDPSGQSIFEAMADDVGEFVCGEMGREGNEWFLPKRIALTAAQVELYDLPTAPPKRSDTRSRNWSGETCQAEAMDPERLAGLLATAIEGELNMDRRAKLLAEEKQERAELITEVEAKLGDRG